MIKLSYILTIALSIFLCSCAKEDEDLPPVEQRVSEAKAALLADLTAPADGWRLEYQPTATSGTFLMLLKFGEDGNVTIQSDVADNDGEFYEQTIPYRIDNALGLELILETYGVFHYLFEQEQAGFGAEFEFIFSEKDGDNLVFQSVTDLGAPTVLTFEPAGSSDENLFSRDISKNLNAFAGQMPDALALVSPIQQLVIHDKNISVFWAFDAAKRTIQVDFAGEGSTLDEIMTMDNTVGIFHNSGYTLLDNKMVLKNPITFGYNGSEIEISEIILTDFSMTGPSPCPENSDPSPEYSGQIPGLGPVTLSSSYLTSNGSNFQPQAIYSVNIPFIFDAGNNSLSESGSIQEKIPEANGFAFIYDVELINDSIPSTSIGFFLNDGNIAVRQFESTQFENFIEITLTDSTFISGGSTAIDEQSLIEVTDEIFEGGNIYAYNFPQNGVFRLFNPCNGYEIFLVR